VNFEKGATVTDPVAGGAPLLWRLREESPGNTSHHTS